MEERKKSFTEALRYVFFPKEAKGTTFLDRFSLTMMGATDAWVARKDNPQEKELIDTVAALSERMGIRKPPTLLIYQSKLPNAVSIYNGHIAISSDLLNIASGGQTEAVLGHELAHHRHRLRDMVNIIGGAVAIEGSYRGIVRPAIEQYNAQRPRKRPPLLSPQAKQVAGEGMLLAGEVLLLMAYKRSIEFESDREAGLVTGRPEDMKGALEALQKRVREIRSKQLVGETAAPEAIAVAEPAETWSGRVGRRVHELFSDHPPIDARGERMDQLSAKLELERNTDSTLASR